MGTFLPVNPWDEPLRYQFYSRRVEPGLAAGYYRYIFPVGFPPLASGVQSLVRNYGAIAVLFGDHPGAHASKIPGIYLPRHCIPGFVSLLRCPYQVGSGFAADLSIAFSLNPKVEPMEAPNTGRSPRYNLHKTPVDRAIPAGFRYCAVS